MTTERLAARRCSSRLARLRAAIEAAPEPTMGRAGVRAG